MSLAGFGDILFQIPGDDMGDFEFIQEKVLEGNYFQVLGNINALNDTVEYVVPSGKMAFIIEAKISMSTNPFIAINPGAGSIQNINDQVVADLLIDSIVKSKAKIGMAESLNQNVGGSTMAFGISNDGKFNVKGLSLVGNAVKKIEIKNVLDSGKAFAEMSGYLIDV